MKKNDIRWAECDMDVLERHDWIFLLKKAPVISVVPKLDVLVEDVNICLCKHYLNSKDIIGYSFFVKKPESYSVQHANNRVILTHNKVDVHSDQREAFRDHNISLYKFNSFLRPSYWLTTKG